MTAWPTRAFTAPQPWASAIAHLGKTTENRPSRPLHNGLVLVHAGLQSDHAALREIPQGDLPLPRGAVIAVARITDAHQDCGGECSPWAAPDRWHWQLADIHALITPIPTPGGHGLWTPSQNLRHRTAAELPRAACAQAATLRQPTAPPPKKNHPAPRTTIA